MSGWTPGPWGWRQYVGRDDSCFVRGPNDERICGSGSGPVRESNARLIAAAPELAEALQFIADVARMTPGFSPMALQQAGRALAKARGETA